MQIARHVADAIRRGLEFIVHVERMRTPRRVEGHAVRKPLRVQFIRHFSVAPETADVGAVIINAGQRHMHLRVQMRGETPRI